jgi:hypothetical protein
MMTTENLFKFVAIRTPEERDLKTNAIGNFDGNRWINRMLGLVTGDVSLEDARERMSSEFMGSSAYVLRSPDWQAFLMLQEELQRILQVSKDETAFQSSFKSLLTQINSDFISLERFVTSDEFDRLRESLWLSYYSNIALVNRRPQDRPVLEFWLRFWYLLERLMAKDDFETLMQEFNRWKPIVPHQLIQATKTATENKPSESSSGSIPVERENKIAQIKKAIAQLQATRSQINKVFHLKLSEATEKEGEGEIKPIPASGGAQHDLKAPWVLTATEIGTEAVKTLERLDISLTTHDATQISTLLESQVAALESEIFELEHVKRIMFVRGVPVRIRRKDSFNEAKD